MFLEYIFILKYFLICLGLSFLLFFISFFFVFQKPEIEKLSAYECGFNPFGDARSKFEVRFYLVGVLFIIFDLEITFLFPWIIALNNVNIYGIYAMFWFIFVLTLDLFTNEQKEL